MVMEDTVKVIVDYHFASKKKKKEVDTGDWELIYESESMVEKPLASFNIELELVGKKMKVKR